MNYLARVAAYASLFGMGGVIATHHVVTTASNKFRRDEIEASSLLRGKKSLIERINDLESVKGVLARESILANYNPETISMRQVLLTDEERKVAEYVNALVQERRDELQRLCESEEVKQLVKEKNDLQLSVQEVFVLPASATLMAIGAIGIAFAQRRKLYLKIEEDAN